MAMRYQPQGTWRLGAAYRGVVAGGWLAQATGYTSLGPASLIPTTRFTQLQTAAITPFGLSLSANAASDAAGSNSIFSSLTINASPARRNFTFAGVFRVRAIDGAGVGARSSTNDILFRRETNGAYGVRVNGVSSTGGLLSLDVPLHYVLTSNADGIFLSVNGVEVIAAARSASTATTGSPVEVFEDTLRGGAMDLDTGMCVLLNTGLGRDAARSLSSNLWQMFAEPDDENDFAPVAVSRVLQVARAQLGVSAGQVGMKVSRRLHAGGAALAMTGQGVTLRVSRRLRVASAPLVLAPGQVELQYSPATKPGEYTLPIAATAMRLAGGSVRMHVLRRLPVAPAQLQLAVGSIRALVSRRLHAAGARLEVSGGSVSLRFLSQSVPIDVSRIHPSRLIMFDGSGSRLVVFEGSGRRVVVFEGSGKRLRINQMDVKLPTKIGEKWTVDRDRDEISYYAADITKELADRNTTAVSDRVIALPYGIEVLEGPELQVATIDGIERTFVVVMLGDVDGELPEDWKWVARVVCANGERFDKTTWFNQVDP